MGWSGKPLEGKVTGGYRPWVDGLRQRNSYLALNKNGLAGVLGAPREGGDPVPGS